MNNNDYKNIIPRNWIPVDYGTPNKNVVKVLVRTSEGFVHEGSYNRHSRNWVSTADGSIITDVVAWSLCSDSLPEQTRTR